MEPGGWNDRADALTVSGHAFDCDDGALFERAVRKELDPLAGGFRVFEEPLMKDGHGGFVLHGAGEG